MASSLTDLASNGNGLEYPLETAQAQNKFNKGETEAQSISILPKATQQSHAKLGRGPWGLAHQSRPWQGREGEERAGQGRAGQGRLTAGDDLGGKAKHTQPQAGKGSNSWRSRERGLPGRSLTGFRGGRGTWEHCSLSLAHPSSPGLGPQRQGEPQTPSLPAEGNRGSRGGPSDDPGALLCCGRRLSPQLSPPLRALPCPLVPA